MDLIIADVGFTFPLDKYKGYDVVLWGQPEKVKQGDVGGMPCISCVLCNAEPSQAPPAYCFSLVSSALLLPQ